MESPCLSMCECCHYFLCACNIPMGVCYGTEVDEDIFISVIHFAGV